MRYRLHPTADVPRFRARIAAVAAALLLLLLAIADAPARAAISIPPNTWVKQPKPAQTVLPGYPGKFEARGWNHLLYNPLSKRMILYDGYLEASRPYSIYANALWTYDPVANRLYLESVSNWARIGNLTVPLPQNTTDPTPYDRHSYACIAFVPETNRLYLWGGANSSIRESYLGDTWVYDFSLRKWRQVVTPVHPFNIFEQTMTHDPSARRLVLYGGAPRAYEAGEQAWLFHLDTETWESVATPSTPSQRMSHSMTFDSYRCVSWMFGGGNYPDPGNELWSFDATARMWQRVTPAGVVPAARRFGSMAYDSRHDILMLWGGVVDDNRQYNDTWIFRPSTRQWQQLYPAVPPPLPVSNAEDLAYDPENDVFVLHQGGEFWFFRYEPGGDGLPPKDVGDLRVR